MLPRRASSRQRLLSRSLNFNTLAPLHVSLLPPLECELSENFYQPLKSLIYESCPIKAVANMDATLSQLVEPLKGINGAAAAVALSVGLLLLTVLQYVSIPKTSVPASLPLKVEAVGFSEDPLMHQQRCLTMCSVLMLFGSSTSIPSKA